ncbi:MAG: CRISPR-associated protein Cas4 [Anaerolineae bacterium]
MAGFAVVLSLLLFLLALLLLWLAQRARQATGLPVGRVVYADTGAWARCERPLFSHRYLLTGRPDYLVEQQGRKIPIEVKSRTAPPAPYLSHVLQLAAYCLLVEETYGQPPLHGIIKYEDRAFQVEYTPELRERLLASLDDMRGDLTAEDVSPSHSESRRCRACGYLQVCGEDHLI